jgi:hypothetical protein
MCLYLDMVGLTAARNMLGKNEEINTVPFFWTMQFGKSVRYCGMSRYFISMLRLGIVGILGVHGVIGAQAAQVHNPVPYLV